MITGERNVKTEENTTHDVSNEKSMSEKLSWLAADLERRRKQAGVSQYQMSQCLNITIPTLRRYIEDDFRSCKLETFLQLLKFYESISINTDFM